MNISSDNLMSECGETPFLLAARGNRSVYLRVWGEEIPAGAGGEVPLCATANRVLIYSALSGRLVRAVCPSATGAVVQVFTDEWWGRGGARGGGALLVVWAARDAGSARFAWMEVIIHLT